MAYLPIRIVIVILAALSLYLVSSQSTDFNPRSFQCSHITNARISYINNVNLLFSDFISQSSEKGYYNTSIGESPDTVFGHYMCRGDLEPQDCESCIGNGTQFAQDANCEYHDGVFLSPKCVFQYSDQSLYGLWKTSFSQFSTSVSDFQEYNATLSSTTDALINESAFGTANNTGSVLGFATKEANVTGDEKIYSLAQCTPDILGVNCSNCLRDALSDFLSSYHGYKGAQVASAKCLLQYNNQTFYDLDEKTL